MDSNPKVSIIILNWNGLSDTIECLESVRKINYSCYDVIVVDNGSTDGSQEEIKKSFTEATLLENKENLGYAEGNNIGIRYALNNKAEYICILNNDVAVDSNFLMNLVQVANKDNSIGILGPTVLEYDDPEIIYSKGIRIQWDKVLTNSKTPYAIFAALDKGNTYKEHKRDFKEVDSIMGCVL
ncbi:glycosyltransferase family 2 protein, partial [Candidatus Omnitrophota bacterium]